MNEGNQQILTNREGDKIQNYAKGFEKFFIDIRVSLVIYQHEKDIFSHMLNYLLKGFKTHPTGSSFHFTGSGCTKRAVEITLIGWFDGQNRGCAPNNRLVQKGRDKKRS